MYADDLAVTSTKKENMQKMFDIVFVHKGSLNSDYTLTFVV